MRRLFAFLAATAVFCLPAVAAAAPAPTTQLQIMPLQCSLDSVTSGQQTTTQVAPDACEPALEPEDLPSLPLDLELAFSPGVPVFLQTDILDQPAGVPDVAAKEVEANNTISPLGEVTTIGRTVINNPGYSTAGLAASVPAIFVADTFLLNGRLRRLLSLMKDKIPGI